MKIKHSPEQVKFFQLVEAMMLGKSDYEKILLEAVAGSGKTFSIVESTRYLPRHCKARFFAFNKSIATELSKKLPSSITVSTVHSFGMQLIGESLRCRVKVDSFKSWKPVEEAIKFCGVKFDTKAKHTAFVFEIMKIIDMCRVNLTDLTGDKQADRELINKLVLDYSIEPSQDNWVVFSKAWERISAYNEAVFDGKHGGEMTMDFIDMIYLPVVFKDKMSFPRHDIVYTDEAQDLSVCQQEIVKLAIGGGKAVYVGDPRQSIYAFCGADSKSWNNLATAPRTIKTSLPVCFRCAKSVVNHARKVYDHIQPFEGQIDGIVELDGNVFNAGAGDFVLCRNTKPLIELWYGFVAENKKACVRGDDDKRDLLKVVQKYHDCTVQQGIHNLNLDLSKIAETLVSQGVEKPREHRKYKEFSEKIDCVKLIAEKSGLSSMRQVVERIEFIFSGDDSDKTVMMTMHKSKGLEAENVYIVRLDLLPSKWARTDVEKEQEKNLEYVAYTRAKKRLVIDKTWSDKD